MSVDPVGRAYRVVADRYIELFGTTASVHTDDLAFVERHLVIRPGTVLDVGCGPGHLTAHLRSLGVDAIGLDAVPEFLEHAGRTDPGARCVAGALPHLPVARRSAVGVLAWYSLIHVPPEDLDAVLADIRRTMASGGTLVIGFFDGEVVEPFDHQVVTAYRWPVSELADRLTDAGFREVDRQVRASVHETGRRPHAAVAVIAADS